MTVTLHSGSKAKLTRPQVQRLTNGLTIITESMPVESVNLSLWLNVGSAVETLDINGMAHFLEHMVFKGTERIPNRVFEQQIESRGAVTNAATSQDYTHYYITTAPQDFAELAPLQVDVVLNAEVPEFAFEQERAVVLEEIRRANDNPQRRTFQQVLELVFGPSPYHRPVLGPADVVARLTANQMRNFHRMWYQPSSITAVAVGNLESETLANTVALAFDRLISTPAPLGLDPLPGLPCLSELGAIASFEEIQRVEYSDPLLQQARMILAWRVPGLNDLPRTLALDVLASILGHGRTSRLVQALREQQGLVTSISANNMTYQHQGMFYIAAQLPVENIPLVEIAIATEVSKLLEAGVLATELRRVQRQVANRFIFGTETPSDRAGLYGYYYALTGEIEPALTYPDQVCNLTAQDLNQAAQEFLQPDAYAIVVARPNAQS